MEQSAEGDSVTRWRERSPTAGDQGYERVAERVHLQVESFGERITRITAIVEIRGWRDGAWVGLDGSEALERSVLARIRAALR